MPKNSRVISKILSPVVFILLWYAVAHIIKAPLILPYPHSVIIRFFELCKSLMFWQSFLFSFLRVILAFAISFIGGFGLGLLAADFPSFKAFMQFPLSVIRVTPLVAFILIALFWFKSGSVPVFVAVVMTLPVMASASTPRGLPACCRSGLATRTIPSGATRRHSAFRRTNGTM